MVNFISLCNPNLNGNEWKYVKECLDTNWVSSAGTYVDLFEKKIAEYTGAKYAIACVNGTSALQVSLRLAGVKQGDEVIAPTLTFIAPINAIAYNGADPVFMDADEFYNLDSKKTIQFIENKTEYRGGFTYNKSSGKRISAIVPVHIWGNACWLDDLIEVCKVRNIAIVEDASESLGTMYNMGKLRGKHTGTIGKLGCLSFNGNKIITTGGGGMILTDDEELAQKAKYLTTQAKDNEITYIHNEIGYNFRLTNIQAALGVAQLEQLSNFIRRKKEIYTIYTSIFKDSEFKIAGTPQYANNNNWLSLLQITNGIATNNHIKKLSNAHIQARPIWHLNHLQKIYIGCQNYKITKAPLLLNNSLCLPSSVSLKNEDIRKVCSILNG